jgi:hypothetical protein
MQAQADRQISIHTTQKHRHTQKEIHQHKDKNETQGRETRQKGHQRGEGRNTQGNHGVKGENNIRRRQVRSAQKDMGHRGGWGGGGETSEIPEERHKKIRESERRLTTGTPWERRETKNPIIHIENEVNEEYQSVVSFSSSQQILLHHLLVVRQGR